MNEEKIKFLVDLIKNIIEIIKGETKVVDFWESYSKQKRLKSYIISHLLKSPLPPPKYNKDQFVVGESPTPYYTDKRRLLFERRNEIAQRLMELSYHIYGK